ncbi:MAG: pilus assembly protein [Rhodobacteraceae bacterium]|nr:pilus assembly protein [Paracoccaceae bacterium]
MNVRENTQPMKQAATRPAFLFRHARAFTRDEDGALVIFGVYVFLIILMVAGIGVDLMHFERNRAHLQYTLDRAVLAAADLDNEDAHAVVTDYFQKAGLEEYLSSVTINEGEGFRSVSATAAAEVRTQFMHMTGIDSLMAPAASSAEERVDGIEISLVLDVSGSMGWNNRLPNLQIAARDFIDQMFENTEEGKLSISIIPYATQVSAPQELFDEFNVSQEHNYSRCINFENSEFSDTSMSTGFPYERTMHFNVFHYFEGRDQTPQQLVPVPVCEAAAANEIMVLENDPVVLKAFINNLVANGNTSIDIGMKWGTALIDPDMNPVIQSMIAGGFVDPTFGTRPHAYDNTDALKVIVLMTDGENTDQYFLEDTYRTGDSDVWWNEEEQRYSIYDADRDEYYWPEDDDWEHHPFGDDEDGDAVRLAYSELWAFTSVAENLRENYQPWWEGPGSIWNTWYWGVFDSVPAATKNTRTEAICDAAKSQQVIVFAIGFEAPAAGQAILANCASSPSHFFDVDGLEIADAFAAIASSIRKLRLTQ